MKTWIVALGIVVVLLSLSLWANFVYTFENGSFRNLTADLTNQISSLNLQISQVNSQVESQVNQKAALENEVAVLRDEKANLIAEKASLMTQLAQNASEIERLERQTSKLQAQLTIFQNRTLVLLPFEEKERDKVLGSSQDDLPFLITRLGVTDVRDTGPTRLFIEGRVYNIGTATANNARLHVIAYQGNYTVADFVIELGTLEVYSSKSVSVNHQYSGNMLSSWNIIPEFDNASTTGLT